MRSVLLCIMFAAGNSTPVVGQQPKEITSSIGMKLVRINPGSFSMGLQVGAPGRSGGESLHEVTITKSFYLGVFEVTQESYEKVMRYNPSHNKGRQLPVEMISWMDAISFCNKLSELPEEKIAGRAYRLPTEAEWEYACRATSGSAFSFGDTADLIGDYAWFGENSEGTTHPVGEKKANRWGLHDMHGNVSEWCQDWYKFQPSSVESDPKGPLLGSLRVRRGGSWYHELQYCTAGYRYAFESTSRNRDCGFRVAMNLPAMQPESVSDK